MRVIAQAMLPALSKRLRGAIGRSWDALLDSVRRIDALRTHRRGRMTGDRCCERRISAPARRPLRVTSRVSRLSYRHLCRCLSTT